jgi:hypothetical protein
VKAAVNSAFLIGQFYFDAELMARETVALQLVVPETTLIDVLASEPQPPVGGKREFEAPLGIGDVDNILAVVVDRTNVKFSFLIVDSGLPTPLAQQERPRRLPSRQIGWHFAL